MQSIGFPDTISARQMQRGYSRVFKAVKKAQKPVIVMANNNPQAAIISLEMLNEYNQLRLDQEIFQLINRLGTINKDKNADEILAEVTADVNQIRQGIYEKTFGGN